MANIRVENGGGVAPAPPAKIMRAVSGGGGGGGVSGEANGDAFGHHAIRDISRGRGESAVKTSAYITGESIQDTRLGLTFGRAEKAGRVLAIGTVGPKGQKWTAGELWNGAETSETRKNSRTAQERNLALPHELDNEAHKRLLNGFALWHRDEYGTAATWALHEPNERGDSRNTHGHIMTTTRVVKMDDAGRPVFGEKVRALSGDKKTVAAEIEKQRAEWAARVNAELERAGSMTRLDHRSHERRAAAGDGPIGLEVGQHRGPKRTAIDRRGKGDAVRDAEAARQQRNKERQRQWETGERVAKNTIEGIAAAGDTTNEREAAAAQRWQQKQQKDWESWRKRQEFEEKKNDRSR